MTARHQKVLKTKRQTLPTGFMERKRFEKLEKDLEEERARNSLLVDEMSKMLDEQEPAAGTSSVVQPSDTGCQSSIEFEGNVPSSTQRSKATTSFEETKFMASINQLSVSSVNVPECRPAIESEDINRHTFEQWRDLLVDSMALAGITEEVTKFTIFKVKAGPRLLDIYRNAKADADAPDADLFPFTHALYRLKAYFGSGKSIVY